MPRAAVWLGCALLAGAVWAQQVETNQQVAEPSTPGPKLLAVEHFELANGMTFLLVERPASATVAAGWVVSSGSADDPAGLSGLAHVLEHMMFKSTDVMRVGELAMLYANAGATGLNAMTQQDLTAFFVSLPAEKLELWFWLESDRLLGPAFSGLEAERQVVRQERQLLVESTPTGRLEEELDARFWGDHPYARPTSGDPADLENIDGDAVRCFFETHYGTANLTAVLVGAFDSAAVRDLAERYFGRLGGDAGTTGELRVPAAKLTPGIVSAACDCRTQARVLYRGVPFGDPSQAAIDVLVAVLNGRSGRLHRSLVLDQEIAFAAFAQHDGLRLGGVLSLSAEAKGGTGSEALLAALDRELQRLVTEPPDERELTKAKNRLKADAIRAIEEPSQLMLRLLIHAGLGQPDQLDTWLSRVDVVCAADVQAVAGRLLLDAPRVVGLFERSQE